MTYPNVSMCHICGHLCTLHGSKGCEIGGGNLVLAGCGCRANYVGIPAEIHCEGTEEITCPYCGEEWGYSWEFWKFSDTRELSFECCECKHTFVCSPEYSVKYWSSK